MSYSRVLTVVQNGTVSDFSDASKWAYSDAWSSGRVVSLSLSLAQTDGEQTFDLGLLFTTIESVIIHNKNTTDFVVVEVAGNSGACIQRVPYGETLKLTDVLESGDLKLTADTTDAEVDVVIIGS